jgi:hypothetical protein
MRKPLLAAAALLAAAWTSPLPARYYPGYGYSPGFNYYSGIAGYPGVYPPGWYNPYVSPYIVQPVDPAAYGYGLGEARRGLADVIRSEGEAALNLTEAAIAFEHARNLAVDNHVKEVTTRHELQKLGRAVRQEHFAEVRERREKYLANKVSGQPPRLGPNDLNHATGKIIWPVALTRPDFDAFRQELEELFLVRAYTKTDVSQDIYETTRALQEHLKDYASVFSVNDYMHARKFLESLAQEGQYAVK